MKRYLLSSAALLIGGFADPAALAQAVPASGDSGAVEVVTVTAERRSESIQTVPTTISAFGADQLAASSVKSVQDLQGLVSGYTPPDPEGLQPTRLRGVGTATSGISADSAVPLYVDGVYIAFPTPSLYSLADAESVEIDKGPQGTLFGRNAAAGIIQITTRNPTDTFAANGDLTYGSFNTISGSAFVGGQVADGVLASFSVQALHQGDGYGTNLVTGEGVNRIDSSVNLRTKWIADLSGGLTATINADYEYLRGFGIGTFQLIPGTGNIFGPQPVTDNPWDQDLGTVPDYKSVSGGVSVRLDQELGFATLSSLSAYRGFGVHSDNNDLDVAPPAAFVLNEHLQGDQASEEILLSSSGAGPFTWTAGFNYYWQDESDRNLTTYDFPFYPFVFPYPQDTTHMASTVSSGSIFAQGSYALEPDTKLTLGGRFTIETRRITESETTIITPPTSTTIPSPHFSVDYHVPTWRAALDHNFTDDILGYVSISRGFTAGGFNMNAPGDPAFKPEYLTAYEIGMKNEFFDHQLRLNYSGFYYNFSGIQETEITLSGQKIYNGPSAKVYGFDLDAEWRVTPQFTIDGSLEALHSEFGNFPNAVFSTFLGVGIGYEQVPGNAKGNALPLSPGFTSALHGDYQWPTSIGDFDFSGGWAYDSGYVFEPDNHLHQKAFNLFDASVLFSFPSANWTVRAWGRNLSNEAVAGYGGTNPISTGEILQPPRTFGVTVGWKY
jgi:outer membrane receptor protein involved in Fe transport